MEDAAKVPGIRDPRRRLLILAALWTFALTVLVVFRSVVLPFAAAGLIAYIVAPLVDRISRLRVGKRTVPRWLAILAIYVLFFLLAYLGTLVLIPQLYRELARISGDAMEWMSALTPERVAELTARAESWLSERGLPVDLTAGPADQDPHDGMHLRLDLQQYLADSAQRLSGWARANFANIVNVARRVVTAVLAFVFMLFFVLMVAAYLSIDVLKVRRYVGSLVPPEWADDARFLVHRIDRMLSGVVRGQVTICLVNGVLTLVGLLLFKVKFAFLLATLAAALSLIPIFGSIISSVPIVAIALSQSWKQALAMLAWIIGIHALEAYFLNPKIMGSAARIHPLIVLFSLIAGERTFGLVGALFAVPIAAIVVACFDFARHKAQGSVPPPFEGDAPWA